MSRKLIGRYIVVDSQICHGKPTFNGTRIMVADVLEMVAMGMAWDSISAQWDGKITREAIAEAVSLSRKAFLEHVNDYAVETIPA